MAAHVNPAYYQHSSASHGPHMVAYVNPAYFQPSALHGEHMTATRGHGRTKHGKAGVHAAKLGRRHGSPMPAMHDPFHGKAMGRNKR